MTLNVCSAVSSHHAYCPLSPSYSLTSPDMSARGTLVLQNRIAPLCRMILVISVSSPFDVGWLANAVQPIAASVSAIWKQSLRETGRPCNGPRSTPDALYSASSCRAASIALSNNISDRQLTWIVVSAHNVRVSTGGLGRPLRERTSCCAMAARLQNATVTYDISC